MGKEIEEKKLSPEEELLKLGEKASKLPMEDRITNLQSNLRIWQQELTGLNNKIVSLEYKMAQTEGALTFAMSYKKQIIDKEEKEKK